MPDEDTTTRLEKAERFLRTARLAYDDGDYDSCVSRAYYAAFHGCIALLVCHVDKKAVDWKHQTIINNFIGAFTKRRKWFNQLKDTGGAKSFAESLRNLRLTREDADYGVDLIDKRRARIALQFAERLLGEVTRRIE